MFYFNSQTKVYQLICSVMTEAKIINLEIIQTHQKAKQFLSLPGTAGSSGGHRLTGQQASSILPHSGSCSNYGTPLHFPLVISSEFCCVRAVELSQKVGHSHTWKNPQKGYVTCAAVNRQDIHSAHL